MFFQMYRFSCIIVVNANFMPYSALRKKCPYSELFWSTFSRIRTEYGGIRSNKCNVKSILFSNLLAPFQLLLKWTINCSFKCNTVHQGAPLSPTSSVPSSAASAPPLDEPFCTNLYIKDCINKCKHRCNSNATSSTPLSATSNALYCAS